MSPRQKIILMVSAVLVGGAFISFIQLARTDSVYLALAIGYFYALSLFIAFFIVNKLVAAKLSVLPAAQQLILRSLVYTVAISFAYLAGFVFQTVLLLPLENLSESIINTVWKGFVYLIASPFNGQASPPLFTDELRTLSVTFFAMVFLIGVGSIVGSFIEIRWRESKQRQAVERAELTALRGQIEPHFLFNSLNTIASLIRSDAQKAETLLLQLSDIMRYFHGTRMNTSELGSELKFTREYVSLLEARFEDKLSVVWRVAETDPTRQVPILLIQPLIENAIRHGLSGEKTALCIEISIEETHGMLAIQVKDNGLGIRPDKLKQIPVNGHALANIKERLSLLFKRDDLLSIDSDFGDGTVVAIQIPL